ncbi:MAG: hypothetical protein Q7R85_03480 [bacterium]|nr:hypothetical protein [bacterium]
MSTYGAFHIYRKFFIFGTLLVLVALVLPMSVIAAEKTSPNAEHSVLPAPSAPSTGAIGSLPAPQYQAADVIYQIEHLQSLVDRAAKSPDGSAEAYPLDLFQIPGAPQLRVAADNGVLTVGLSGTGVYNVSGTLLGAENAALGKFSGSNFSVTLDQYADKNPRALVVSVTYLPEKTPIFYEGPTGSGGLRLPPPIPTTVPAPAEGISERISEPVITSSGPSVSKSPAETLPPIGEPPTESQSGPEIVPPETATEDISVTLEMVPSEAGAVAKSEQAAPTEERIEFNFDFIPESADSDTQLIIGTDIAPLGRSFGDGEPLNTRPSVGELLVSDFLPPLLTTGPIVTDQQPPIIGLGESEQVNAIAPEVSGDLEFADEGEAPATQKNLSDGLSAVGGGTFDGDMLNFSSQDFRLPSGLVVGDISVASNLPQFLTPTQIVISDLPAPIIGKGSPLQINAVVPDDGPAPEPVDVTLELVDGVADAVQGAVETIYETLRFQ